MIVFARPWVLLLMFAVPLVPLLVRRSSARHKWLLAFLRGFSLILLGLAAAGPAVRVPSDRVDVMFVLDSSDSMGYRGMSEALERVNRMVDDMGTEDHAGLVTVAKEAALEAPPLPRGGRVFEPAVRHDGSQSRLADGIYAGIAALPGMGEGRIVLVSDGRETGGGLEEAVRFARDSGMVVDVIPIGGASAYDAAVRELRAPRRIAEGETHEISVLLHAQQNTLARLIILRNGEYVGEDQLTLTPGETLRRYEMPAAEVGASVYEVILEAALDETVENNRGLAVVEVEGAKRVLWVGRGRSAVPAGLELQGIAVDVVEPGDIPDTLEAFSPWDAVILDNVSSRELSFQTHALLENWVRNRGGGLMMVGGDAGFGLGGWHGTPVEQALPVKMDAPSSLYIPSLSMVMVVDKSGSMGGDIGDGRTKLDLVKNAVALAVEVLNPLYSLGVVAFDADMEWTVPLTQVENGRRIFEGLSGLGSGGGTVLYPAVQEAYERLVLSPAAVRHLVILSDGLAESADFSALAQAIARDGITMSTVAVGRDADSALMADMAEQGGGRYWYAEDATQVPRIFASESMIVSRGLVVEETVFPSVVTVAEALEGVEMNGIPPLHGYVITSADPASVEALRSPRGHPLLIYGQHGLGRSVAFSSDLRGSWGRDWVLWDQFPRLIAQSVRWMRRSAGLSGDSLRLWNSSDGVRVVLEARSPDGAFRTNLRPRGRLTTPNQKEEREFAMEQTAPGRYEGVFHPEEDGVYQAAVLDEEKDVSMWSYWTRPYSPELLSKGVDDAVLQTLVRIGNGRLLLGGEGEEDWWAVRRPRRRTLLDLTVILALTALAVFLVDIAIRELGRASHEKRPRDRETGEDLDRMIRQSLDDARRRAKQQRITPSEASRILAERRARREGRF